MWCVGVFENYGAGENVIGSVNMRGYDVIFDRSNDRIGFAVSNCDGQTQDTVKEFTQLSTKVESESLSSIATPVQDIKIKQHTTKKEISLIIYILLGFAILLLL